MNTQRRPTSYITLDLTLPDVQTSLAVTQGDTTRRIVATIQDGGRPFELPRKWTAMLTGTKPDGKFLYNSCVIDYSGRIVYDFAAGTEIATAIGDYAVTFEIYDEAGDKVSSPSLWLSVKPDKTRDHASNDQFTAAQEILGRLNKVEDGLDFLEGDQDSEYIAYEGASLIRVNREAPNGYDALKVSSYTDYLHIVKFDSTLYEVATNELAGYWVEINGKRAYVGSNTVDSLTLYTDHTMTRPSAFLAYPGDLIYILGDDVTDDMVDVIGAAPEDEYLMYNGTSLIRLNRETPSGYDALTVSSAVDGLHIVKFDSTLYDVETNELAGYWVEINGKRAYVGSNTVDSLTLYTDHTMTRPRAFFVSAGTLIYILGDDVTDAMLGVIGAAPAGFGLGENIGVIPSNGVATLSFENSIFSALVSIRGRIGGSFALFAVNGYGIGGKDRMRIAPIHYGDKTLFGYAPQGEKSVMAIYNNENVEASVNVLMLIGNLPTFTQNTDGGATVEQYEWGNPPMDEGKEYRTTERRDGKPVYRKIIDCFGLPANGSKEITTGIDNLKIIRSTMFAIDKSTSKQLLMLPFFDGKIHARYLFTQYKVHITTDSEVFGDYTESKLELWYTKD